MINMVKLPTNNKRMILRVARGHFATSHSHINYYIDVTMQKTRLSDRRPACPRRQRLRANWSICTRAPPLWTPSCVWTAPR